QSRIITVSPTSQAQFDAVDPITVNCGQATTSPLHYANNNSTSGCSIAGTVMSTLSSQSPSGYCGGNIIESWSFIDDCGRTSVQSRIITVSPTAQAQFDAVDPITVNCGQATPSPLHYSNNNYTSGCSISG